MKLASAAFSLALAATAAAQRAIIAAPTMGTNIPAGSSFTIEVDRPSFISSALEVSVVLGIKSCSWTGGTCSDPETNGFLGATDILYNGPFNPQSLPGSGVHPPFQNFTVQIPANLDKGPAQIDMVHFNLVGAVLVPTVQYDSVQVNIV